MGHFHPFSIAMLNNQRVSIFLINGMCWGWKIKNEIWNTWKPICDFCRSYGPPKLTSSTQLCQLCWIKSFMAQARGYLNVKYLLQPLMFFENAGSIHNLVSQLWRYERKENLGFSTLNAGETIRSPRPWWFNPRYEKIIGCSGITLW